MILGITSIGVYGIALSGWSSNNKYSLLGSLRSSAQLISYELALGLSLVGVVLRAGSLNLREIVENQSHRGILSWNLFGGFQFVAFFIYLMAAYAETNRSPFDLPEAESELTARLSHRVQLHEVRHVLHGRVRQHDHGRLRRHTALSRRLDQPLRRPHSAAAELFVQALFPIFWFVLKVFSFLFLYVWVRGTLPRFRYDQLMNFGWRYLLPLAILNIVGTSLWLAYQANSAAVTFCGNALSYNRRGFPKQFDLLRTSLR